MRCEVHLVHEAHPVRVLRPREGGGGGGNERGGECRAVRARALLLETEGSEGASDLGSGLLHLWLPLGCRCRCRCRSRCRCRCRCRCRRDLARRDCSTLVLSRQSMQLVRNTPHCWLSLPEISLPHLGYPLQIVQIDKMISMFYTFSEA